jgi:hypothetical protein
MRYDTHVSPFGRLFEQDTGDSKQLIASVAADNAGFIEQGGNGGIRVAMAPVWEVAARLPASEKPAFTAATKAPLRLAKKRVYKASAAF